MSEITTGHTRITVDLHDRIDEVDDGIDTLQRALGALTGGGEDADSEEDPANLLADFSAEPAEADVRDAIRRLEHSRDLLQADADRFGGSEFTIKKFRAGDLARVNDLVLQDTIQDGLDDPRAKLDARKLRTIQVGVTELPPDAPDDPKRFEIPTMEFLFQCIDNLNVYGKVSLEDF